MECLRLELRDCTTVADTGRPTDWIWTNWWEWLPRSGQAQDIFCSRWSSPDSKWLLLTGTLKNNCSFKEALQKLLLTSDTKNLFCHSPPVHEPRNFYWGRLLGKSWCGIGHFLCKTCPTVVVNKNFGWHFLHALPAQKLAGFLDTYVKVFLNWEWETVNSYYFN